MSAEENKAVGAELVEIDATNCADLAMIDVRGQVWVAFARPWWDLAGWICWVLMPGGRSWVLLRKANGQRVRVRAYCVATRHVRIFAR